MWSSSPTAPAIARPPFSPIMPAIPACQTKTEPTHPRRVRTLLKPVSQGKAAGLNDAIKLASGEVLLFTDARQQIESGALRLLIENFADPDVGAASGELMLGDPTSGETGKGMGLYWRIEKKIRELESASGSVAGATGAIYCARRSLLDESPLPEGTILDDVLLPMQIVRKGFRVIFDARARAWDSPDLGESREFSRKVRTLSGNYQLLQLAPWLLSSENAIRFEFVSHKLSRLAVPFALLALLIASDVPAPAALSRGARGAACVLRAQSSRAFGRQDRTTLAHCRSRPHFRCPQFRRPGRLHQLCHRQKGSVGPLNNVR